MMDAEVGNPMEFSFTIGAQRQDNLKLGTYRKICNYLRDWSVRFIACLERGDECGHLHLQGLVCFGVNKPFVDVTKMNAALRKHLRDNCDFDDTEKIKCTVKQLERGQTWQRKYNPLSVSLSAYLGLFLPAAISVV